MTTTAAQTLTTLRAELADVEHAEADATSTMDTDGVIAAQHRGAVLKQFIARAEVAAAAEAEAAGKACAAAWLDAQSAALAKSGARITRAKARVQECVEATLRAIQAEAAARAEPKIIQGTAQVLAARFGVPAPAAPEVPYVEDWAEPITAAMMQLARQRRPIPGLVLSHPASMPPEQRHVRTLRAVHEWVTRHGAALPPEVKAMLDAAPVPARFLSDAPRAPTAREQWQAKEHAAMAQEVAEARRALRSIPGEVGSGFGVG